MVKSVRVVLLSIASKFRPGIYKVTFNSSSSPVQDLQQGIARSHPKLSQFFFPKFEDIHCDGIASSCIADHHF